MSRFLADENVNPLVVRELRARPARIDIVSADEAGLRSVADADILEWAARDGRVVITHDLRTMVRDAWARVRLGQVMPGVVFIANTTPVGAVLDILATVAEAGEDEDFRDRVVHLP